MERDFTRADYGQVPHGDFQPIYLSETDVARIVGKLAGELNAGKEVCDYHEDSQKLMVSINTKLTGLLWVLGVFITVFGLPYIVYIVNLEKRLTFLEDKMVRLVEQRNSDHPNYKFR